MTTYYKLVFEEGLQLPKSHFAENIETLNSRLLSASEGMKNVGNVFSNSDFFGINQCVHLATSVVLLGCTEENLKRTIGIIRSGNQFDDIDPTTILTIATLYYILVKYLPSNLGVINAFGHAPDQTERNIDPFEMAELFKDVNIINTEGLKIIHKHFDRVNWLIGTEAMNTLEIVSL